VPRPLSVPEFFRNFFSLYLHVSSLVTASTGGGVLFSTSSRTKRGVFVKGLNNPYKLCTLGLAFTVLWPVLASERASERPLGVGYVSLTAARESQKQGEPSNFAPQLLVGFDRSDHKARVLALTDNIGMAYVPMEAGSYCATAYGSDGKPVQMSERSLERIHRCFSIEAGTAMEFSVTIAARATYARTFPSLSVK
jgi:hypothetical protein